MITQITFQFRYNKAYLNKSLVKKHALGNQYTTDLEKYLAEDALLFKKLCSIIHLLNADLSVKCTPFLQDCFTGQKISVTEKTKTTRTYFIHGLTIHEDDKL